MDCFNCKDLLFLGNTSEGICVCLYHRIQIEPNPGVACDYWTEGGNFDDYFHDNDAMDRSEQKNTLIVPYKE